MERDEKFPARIRGQFRVSFLLWWLGRWEEEVGACLGVGVDLSEKQRLVGWFSAGTDWSNVLFTFAQFFAFSWLKKGWFTLSGRRDWEDTRVGGPLPLVPQAALSCNPFHKLWEFAPGRNWFPNAFAPGLYPSVHANRSWRITWFFNHTLGNFLGK